MAVPMSGVAARYRARPRSSRRLRAGSDTGNLLARSYTRGAASATASERLPAGAAVVRRLLVQQFDQNLAGLDGSWSGPVEVLIAVGEIDPSIAHGGEITPLGTISEPVHFGQRARDVESARRHHDDVGVGGEKLLP